MVDQATEPVYQGTGRPADRHPYVSPRRRCTGQLGWTDDALPNANCLNTTSEIILRSDSCIPRNCSGKQTRAFGGVVQKCKDRKAVQILRGAQSDLDTASDGTQAWLRLSAPRTVFCRHAVTEYAGVLFFAVSLGEIAGQFRCFAHET